MSAIIDREVENLAPQDLLDLASRQKQCSGRIIRLQDGDQVVLNELKDVSQPDFFATFTTKDGCVVRLEAKTVGGNQKVLATVFSL